VLGDPLWRVFVYTPARNGIIAQNIVIGGGWAPCRSWWAGRPSRIPITLPAIWLAIIFYRTLPHFWLAAHPEGDYEKAYIPGV